jgi:hypothetical protein
VNLQLESINPVSGIAVIPTNHFFWKASTVPSNQEENQSINLLLFLQKQNLVKSLLLEGLHSPQKSGRKLKKRENNCFLKIYFDSLIIANHFFWKDFGTTCAKMELEPSLVGRGDV